MLAWPPAAARRVLSAALRSVRAEAAATLRDTIKRLAASQAQVGQLAGDVEALQAELAGRPTHAEQRWVQQHLHPTLLQMSRSYMMK